MTLGQGSGQEHKWNEGYVPGEESSWQRADGTLLDLVVLQALQDKADLYEQARGAAESALNQLQVENKKLLEALSELVDHQNGCPLPKYEAGWNNAMAMAGELLREPRA